MPLKSTDPREQKTEAQIAALSLSTQIEAWRTVLSEHGVELSREDALVASGAAFRHALFVAEDNHAWLAEYPGAHWHPGSLSLDNYGVFEALSAQTGWERRSYSGLNPVEVVGLCTHELRAGRPLLVPHESGAIGRVTAIRPPPIAEIELEDGSLFSFASAAAIEALPEALPALIAIRPRPEPLSARVQGALIDDLLRWVPRHAGAGKELDYSAELYFATGRRAFDLLPLWSRELIPPILGTALGDMCRIWWTEHLSELLRGRDALAQVFGAGSALPALESRLSTLSHRREMARCWQDSAMALRSAVELWTRGTDSDIGAEAGEHLRHVAECEAAAVDALRSDIA